MPKQYLHTTGPFAHIQRGDFVRILRSSRREVAIMRVVRVNRHSIAGMDGDYPCRVLVWGGRLEYESAFNPAEVLVVTLERLVDQTERAKQADVAMSA